MGPADGPDDAGARGAIAHWVVIALALGVLWLVLSGHYTPLFYCFGIFSVGFTVWIAHRMGLVDEESTPLGFFSATWSYWPWLGKEIVKANIDVAKVVLDPAKVNPVVIRAPAGQKSDVGVVTFANSITLTPGTVSMEVERDEILVHALTQELADGLLEGEMNARVMALEEA